MPAPAVPERGGAVTFRALLARLDERWPHRGPCGLCGGPDARHRLWDSMDVHGRLEGVAVAARDFGVSTADIRLVIETYVKARRQHRRLPGRHEG